MTRLLGYRVAREVSKDETTKVLYCTEAAVALIMQSRIQRKRSARKPEDVTTVRFIVAQCRATML